MIIQVYDQFLTVDECNYLIDFYNNNKNLSVEFGHEGRCPRWPLQIPENTTEFKLLQNKLNEKAIYANNSVIEYVQIVRWPIGSKQNSHYDKAQDYTTLASIIYLNDNFIGHILELSFFIRNVVYFYHHHMHNLILCHLK